MPIACSRISTCSTGRTRSRPCSATGSVARRAPKSVSRSMLPRRREFGDHDRRLHDPPRHPLRRHLHGAGTRASAGRHPGRRRLRRRRQPGVDGRRRHPGRSRCGLPRSRRADDRRRPSGEQGEDGRLSGCPRDEPGQRRVDPGVHRRLCPDGLRHRRHHGRACPGRERDWDFAMEFGLPIIRTVQPPATSTTPSPATVPTSAMVRP